MVKNQLSMQEIQVHYLGWEDPLEKEIIVHSIILAWERMNRGPRQAKVHEVTRIRQDLTTKQQHLLAKSSNR